MSGGDRPAVQLINVAPADASAIRIFTGRVEQTGISPLALEMAGRAAQIAVLARPLIEKPLIAWVITVISLVGGLIAYFNIGRLEHPKLAIKTAVVVTLYPGGERTLHLR